LDIASLIGFIGAVGMIVGSMVYAGGVGPFLDIPSILIVVGGTAFAVLSSTSLALYTGSFKAMSRVFKPVPLQREPLIERMFELSNKARKEGIMALEGQPGLDPFFEKGLQMLVDGADEAKLLKELKQEVKAMRQRHEATQGVLRAWVDIGPAMGMIGTLIGLVLMLGNMSDVKAIGPAMAVALLTTLYGAVIANVVFGPMLTKLQSQTAEELEYRALVIEGLRGIARGDNPRHVQDQMIAVLPPKAQERLRDAA
jgi:chemotaxis protein MotA